MAQSNVCDNCFEEFPWEPVRRDGETYCCEGCAQGGPCICTYTGPPPTLQEATSSREVRGEAEVPTREERVPAGDGQRHVCDNCFAEFSWEPVRRDGETYCCEGCAQGGPCVCTYAGPPPTFQPMPTRRRPEAEEEGRAPEEGAEGEAEAPAEAPGEAPLVYPNGHGPFRVLARPLVTPLDVKMFLAQLEELPEVQGAVLLEYEGDRAVYEVRMAALNDMVKALMDMTYFRVQSLRLTSEGVEVTLELPRPATEAVAAQAQRAPAGPAGLPEEVARALQSVAPTTAPRRGDDEEELHPFRYQMGVDVFFNARHQVEVRGVRGPVHSHSWRVQAVIESEARDETGLVVGFDEVREVLEEFVSRYNGQFMNRVPPFDEMMPTAENLARVIYEHAAQTLRDRGVILRAVRVWESPTSYVEFRGEGPEAE